MNFIKFFKDETKIPNYLTHFQRDAGCGSTNITDKFQNAGWNRTKNYKNYLEMSCRCPFSFVVLHQVCSTLRSHFRLYSRYTIYYKGMTKVQFLILISNILDIFSTQQRKIASKICENTRTSMGVRVSA